MSERVIEPQAQMPFYILNKKGEVIGGALDAANAVVLAGTVAGAALGLNYAVDITVMDGDSQKLIARITGDPTLWQQPDPAVLPLVEEKAT